MEPYGVTTVSPLELDNNSDYRRTTDYNLIKHQGRAGTRNIGYSIYLSTRAHPLFKHASGDTVVTG